MGREIGRDPTIVTSSLDQQVRRANGGHRISRRPVVAQILFTRARHRQTKFEQTAALLGGQFRRRPATNACQHKGASSTHSFCYKNRHAIAAAQVPVDNRIGKAGL
jgi:hypothetical protein